jgi:histidyl-tRNA synthetase
MISHVPTYARVYLYHLLQGQLRAICGGGRYDSLLDTFGDSGCKTNKKSTPAVGFGFGDAVIVELLKEKGLLPDFSSAMLAHVVVGATDKALYDKAASTASALRGAGLSVDLVLQDKRLKALLQRADKLQSSRSILYFHLIIAFLVLEV